MRRRVLLGLTTAVLVANALIGERGLVQAMRTQHEHLQLVETIDRIQHENRQLAHLAERLRDDPSAIEELARGDLGLIRSGERLFIITDRP
jgi:cell division protein FtsB